MLPQTGSQRQCAFKTSRSLPVGQGSEHSSAGSSAQGPTGCEPGLGSRGSHRSVGQLRVPGAPSAPCRPGLGLAVCSFTPARNRLPARRRHKLVSHGHRRTLYWLQAKAGVPHPQAEGITRGCGSGRQGCGDHFRVCPPPPPRKQPHQGPPGRLLRIVKLGLPWGLLWSRPSSLPPRCGHHFHWLMATGPLDPSSQRGLGHRAWGQATRSETHRKQRANPHRQPWRAERVSDGVCSGGELPCGT